MADLGAHPIPSQVACLHTLLPAAHGAIFPGWQRPHVHSGRSHCRRATTPEPMPAHGVPRGAQPPLMEGILEGITVHENGQEPRTVHDQCVESSVPCFTLRARLRCVVLVRDLVVIERDSARRLWGH